MYDIGLVIAAFRLPDEARRMVESIQEHENEPCSYRIRVVTEADAPDMDPVLVNLSRLKNIGVRDCLRDCKVIACTDADYIVPCGLLSHVAEMTTTRHLWVLRRDLQEPHAPSRNWIRWLKRPEHETCWGSFNALSADNWRRIGGWDERCFGWGGEDDILHLRIREARIPTIIVRTFPLMHIEHAHRPFRSRGYRSRENMTFADQPQPNFLEEARP